MNVKDFVYDLPQDLIAQEPLVERDQSRLMVLNSEQGTIAHHHFFELPSLLRAGDLLVLNDSKVFPGRLYARKKTGGKVEVLLLRPIPQSDERSWEVMLGGGKVSAGQYIYFDDAEDCSAMIEGRASGETWQIQFSVGGDALRAVVDRLGHVPLPPYIKHSSLSEQELRSRYQTVFAKQEGSVAAPTAGLHFTERVFNALRERGIETTTVTLHVGLGTFAPIKVDDISRHHMHSEFSHINPESAQKIIAAKQSGRRIVAVGTTAVRTVESHMQNGVLQSGDLSTNLFITPGYTFQCVDALITNFHLPRSSLLILVSAFAGLDFVHNAYIEAAKQRYRFYSFGDAMLIE